MYLGPRPRDAREALAAYRKVLVTSARHLPVRGIDLGAADPSTQQRFDLAAVYVDLQAQPSGIDVRVQPGEPRLVQTEQWSLLTPGVLDLVIANRRLVLLGDPGSGKSTFVNHLLLCLAGHGLDSHAGWIERLPNWPADETDIVPVPVLLRDFARSLPRETATRAGNPLLLWRFIVKRLAESKLETAEQAIDSALARSPPQPTALVFATSSMPSLVAIPKRVWSRPAGRSPTRTRPGNSMAFGPPSSRPSTGHGSTGSSHHPARCRFSAASRCRSPPCTPASPSH